MRALEGCLAWLSGCSFGLAAGPPSPRLAVALLAAGLAQRGRSGGVLALAAAGALRVWLLPLDLPGAVEVARARSPVTLLGTLEDGWRRGRFGWDGRLRTRWLVRGRRVERWRATVRVSLSGREPPTSYAELRATGFLSRAPAALNSRSARRGPWRLRVKSRVFLSGEPRASPLRRLGEARHRPPPAAAGPGARWARALLLGDREALSRSVLAGFRALAAAESGRWVVIRSAAPIEDVERQVWAAVSGRLKSAR